MREHIEIGSYTSGKNDQIVDVGDRPELKYLMPLTSPAGGGAREHKSQALGLDVILRSIYVSWKKD